MWVSELEAKVFSIVKTRLADLKTKYPTIYFTTQELSEIDAVFPTWYFKTLAYSEVGEDLSGDVVNGVRFGVQIEVVTNNSMSDVNYIMDRTIEEMKKLRFKLIATPTWLSSGDLKRSVVRFRRIIGAGDAIDN